MKPPAVAAIAVDSDRDALAVIRRMRLQPSSLSLNVDSFNQLIVAAKDDVVKATAAAKDELQYYRKILDIDNTHRRPPRSQQPELKPSTMLPSLAAPPVKLPQVLVTSNQQERPATREKAKPKAAPRQLQELPPPTEKPRSRPQAQTQVAVKAKAAAKQDKKTKVTPPSNQQVHVKMQPPPSKTTTLTSSFSSSSSSKQSKLDCVASFDDDEPELDTAPAWNDHEFTSGYGSDDNM